MTPALRMRPLRIINLLALVVVLLPACNDSSPTAPSQYPDVAGTYSGPLVLTAVVNPDSSESLNGTMRLVVTQSGSQVTLNGTITILGTTEEIPQTVGSINEDGEFTFPGDDFEGAMPDPECGESRITSITLLFLPDGTAVFNQLFETAECGDFTVAATMTRE